MKKIAFFLIGIIGLYSPIIAFSEDTNTQSSTIKSAAMLLHVRILAASCAACHGTDGNSAGNSTKNHDIVTQNDLKHIPSLSGTNATDFISKMQAFKSGQRPATVMHHHAKGLTNQEIEALATYFSQLTSREVTVLKPQSLLTDHGH